MRTAKGKTMTGLMAVLLLVAAGERAGAMEVQVEKLYDDLTTGVMSYLYDTKVLYFFACYLLIKKMILQ